MRSFGNLNKCFNVNLLYLIFNKTRFTHVTTVSFKYWFKDKSPSNMSRTKALDIILDSTLT